jgi:hypothetical protein
LSAHGSLLPGRSEAVKRLYPVGFDVEFRGREQFVDLVSDLTVRGRTWRSG